MPAKTYAIGTNDPGGNLVSFLESTAWSAATSADVRVGFGPGVRMPVIRIYGTGADSLIAQFTNGGNRVLNYVNRGTRLCLSFHLGSQASTWAAAAGNSAIRTSLNAFFDWLHGLTGSGPAWGNGNTYSKIDLTFNHEPENDTARLGPLTDYIAAYRFMHDVYNTWLTAHPSQPRRVRWAWIPIGDTVKNAGAGPHPSYPGNAYVEFICPDMYIWPSNGTPAGGPSPNWNSFTNKIQDVLFTWKDANAPGKPCGLGEFGAEQFVGTDTVAGDPTKHENIYNVEIPAVFDAHPELEYICHFAGSQVPPLVRRYKGLWRPGTAYLASDVVKRSSDGIPVIANRATTGENPNLAANISGTGTATAWHRALDASGADQYGRHFDEGIHDSRMERVSFDGWRAAIVGTTTVTTPDAPTIGAFTAAGSDTAPVDATTHRLHWTLGAAGSFPIAGVEVERTSPGGQVQILAPVPIPTTTRDATGAVVGGTYTYRVRAYDNQAVPNKSVWSAPASVTQSGSVNTTAPPAPASATASAPSSTQVNVSWAAVAASDLDHYEIGLNSVVLKDAAGTAKLRIPATATSYSIVADASGSAIASDTDYTVDVYAVDTAGNVSTPPRRALPAPVHTSAIDTAGPDTPVNFAVVTDAIDPQHVIDLAWDSSLATDTAGYRVMAAAGTAGLVQVATIAARAGRLSYVYGNRVAGTSYRLAILPFDTNGNLGTATPIRTIVTAGVVTAPDVSVVTTPSTTNTRSVRIDITASDPSGGTLSHTIYWGDGASDAIGSFTSKTHVYAYDAVFTGLVYTTSTNGGTLTTPFEVSVTVGGGPFTTYAGLRWPQRGEDISAYMALLRSSVLPTIDGYFKRLGDETVQGPDGTVYPHRQLLRIRGAVAVTDAVPDATTGEQGATELSFGSGGGFSEEMNIATGAAVIGTNVAPPGVEIPYAVTLTSMRVRCGAAPAGGVLTVRARLNGVDIGSTTVAAGATSAEATFAAAPAANVNDVVTFDVTSSSGAADVNIRLIGS